MPHTKIQKALSSVERSLQQSNIRLPLTLKRRVAEIVLHLMSHGKHFGLFIILGWHKKWNRYTDISDSRQDIFEDHRMNIMNEDAPMRRHAIAGTINFDGAILIDRKGHVIHSGVMIEGMRPRAVAEKLHPGRFDDLSAQYGFKEKVHTRHLTAIAASYVFRGITVYTVSEETGTFHIFEGGRIIFTSHYGA